MPIKALETVLQTHVKQRPKDVQGQGHSRLYYTVPELMITCHVTASVLIASQLVPEPSSL